MIELQDSAALRRGRVSPACVLAVATHIVPQAIRRFTALHPAVRVELAELASSEVETHVLQDVVDFGVCGRTVRQADFDQEVVARDPFVAVEPADHAVAQRRTVTLSTRRPYPLIVPRRGTSVRSTRESAFAAAGIAFEPSFETTDHYRLVGMVEAGLGVGALSLMPLWCSGATG